MSNDIAIKVENLTKVYKLYNSPLQRMKEALNPFGRKYHRDFYALSDVSFEVKKGETVGIVGRNGAGKSTLLKIITGVASPTSGNVVVNGRISALLELGAGFNPQISGYENIYFNGTLMGFTREEMDNRLDDILAFADIGEFIHQPVKTYSSGMFVRLAFSVQALIEPEILIVDEALAVGDTLFQKRCYQKMEELIGNGTTLLFVSHDQESIRTLTKHAILLKNGKVYKDSTSPEVVLEYRRLLQQEENARMISASEKLKNSISGKKAAADLRSARLSFGDGDAELLDIKVLNSDFEESSIFYPGETLRISISFVAHKDLTHLNAGIRIRNKEGVKIYSWGTLNQDIAIWSELAEGETFWDREFKAGETCEIILECNMSLGKNHYEVQATISEEEDRYYGAQRILHWRDEAAFFNVLVSRHEYFFGGVCDMKMVAWVKDEKSPGSSPHCEDLQTSWLSDNSPLRMDATRADLFDDRRREFHLARYRFACGYSAGKTVADIASGTGYGCELLATDGKAEKVIGVDISSEAVKYATENHCRNNIEYICTPAGSTGLSDGHVDLVVSFETIEHVDDDIGLIREFARILKPGGKLVCSTPNQWPLEIAEHHVREYDRQRFDQLLSDSFIVEEMYSQNSGSGWKYNHGQKAGINRTTAENESTAEVFLAVCTRK